MVWMLGKPLIPARGRKPDTPRRDDPRDLARKTVNPRKGSETSRPPGWQHRSDNSRKTVNPRKGSETGCGRRRGCGRGCLGKPLIPARGRKRHQVGPRPYQSGRLGKPLIPARRVRPILTGYALVTKKRNQSNDWLRFARRASSAL